MADRSSSSQSGRGAGRAHSTAPSSGAAATSSTGRAANVDRAENVQQLDWPVMPRARAPPNIPWVGAPPYAGNVPAPRAPINVAQGGAPPVAGNMQVNVQQQFVPYHDLRPGQNVGPPQQMAQYGPQWGPWFAPEQPAQPPPPPRLPQQPPNPPPQGLGVNQQQQQRDQQLQLLNRVARGRPPAGARPTGPSGVALTAPPPPGQPMLTGNTHIATRIQNPQSNYGWAIQNAPPVNAVPPLDIQISLMEICTFFPCWFLVPDVIMRAIRNGWTRKDIAKATLHARNHLNRANLKTAENRIQKQISEGGKMYQNLQANDRWDSNAQIEQLGEEDDLTANIWELRARYLQTDNMDWSHVPLAPVANSVTNWPVGQDRKLLTRCLQYAAANPGLNLDTSHWHLIIHSQNFQHPPWVDHNDDVRAVNDLRNNVADP